MPPAPPGQCVVAVIQIAWRDGAQSLLDKKEKRTSASSASTSQVGGGRLFAVCHAFSTRYCLGQQNRHGAGPQVERAEVYATDHQSCTLADLDLRRLRIRPRLFPQNSSLEDSLKLNGNCRPVIRNSPCMRHPGSSMKLPLGAFVASTLLGVALRGASRAWPSRAGGGFKS